MYNFIIFKLSLNFDITKFNLKWKPLLNTLNYYFLLFSLLILDYNSNNKKNPTVVEWNQCDSLRGPGTGTEQVFVHTWKPHISSFHFYF